jgi:hypothetical protein
MVLRLKPVLAANSFCSIPVTPEGGTTPQYQNIRFTAAFKHITIRGSMNPPYGWGTYPLYADQNMHLENFFYPPELSADGKILTFWTRSQPDGDTYFERQNAPTWRFWHPAGHSLPIEVTVESGMRDTSNLPLGVSKRYEYIMVSNADYTGGGGIRVQSLPRLTRM